MRAGGGSVEESEGPMHECGIDCESWFCPEHGEICEDCITCPGCDEDERRIDEAIEREHKAREEKERRTA